MTLYFICSEYKRKQTFSKSQQKLYTTATIRYINHTESPFLEAHNICINSTYHWIIYLKSGSFNVHYPADRSKPLLYISNLAFRWTFKIDVVNRQIPKNALWINEGSFFVSQPWRSNHLAHFIESINQALLKLRYPAKYPLFTDWYIPQFGNNEFNWTQTYLNLLRNLYSKDYRPKMHLLNSYPIKPVTCFRSAVILC